MQAIKLSTLFTAAFACSVGLLACDKKPDAPLPAPVENAATLPAPSNKQTISDIDSTSTYIEAPADAGFLAGSGWDSITGTIKVSTCLEEADGVKTPINSQKLSFQRVVDSASMLKMLNASASAKAKFLGGGAQGSMKFAQSVETSSNDEMVFATAVVGNSLSFVVQPGSLTPNGSGSKSIEFGTTSVLPIKIRQSQLRLARKFVDLASHDPAKFRQECGDGFIRSITDGGTIIIIYRLRSSSIKERNEFSSTLKGSYSTFSASGSLRKVLETKFDTNKVTIEYSRSGGGGSPLPISWDEVQTLLRDFPAEVKNSPVSMVAEIMPYSSLPNFPIKVQGTSVSSLENITDMYARLRDVERESFRIKAIVANNPDDDTYLFEGGATIYGLDNIIKLAGVARQKLKVASNDCLQGRKCVYPSDVPTDDYGLRSGMPILKELSTTQSAITAALQKVKLAEDGAIRLSRAISAGGIGCQVTLPDYKKALAEVEQRRKELSDLEKVYQDRVMDERLSLWVIRPAEARCQIAAYESCLSPDRISKIRSDMIASRANDPWGMAGSLGRMFVAPRCSGGRIDIQRILSH